MISAQAADFAKQEALKDDQNAFSVVIAKKTGPEGQYSYLPVMYSLNHLSRTLQSEVLVHCEGIVQSHFYWELQGLG